MVRARPVALVIGGLAVLGFVGWLRHDKEHRRDDARTEPRATRREPPIREPGSPFQVDDRSRDENAREPSGDSTCADPEVLAAKAWLCKIKGATRGVDPAKLRRAIQIALESRDPHAAYAALVILGEPTRDGLPERSEFRNLVLPYLDVESPSLRAAAVWALRACGPYAEDRPLVLRLAGDADPLVRVAVGAGVGDFLARDCTEATASQAVLALLNDEDRVVNATIVGLRHMALGHEVEKRVIALSEDPRYRQRVVFESLSRLNPKSDQVVDALIQVVQVDRGDVRKNAVWGLRTGVPQTARPRVAEAMLNVLSDTAYDDVGRDCVDLVVAYGDAEHLDRLRSLATDLRQPEKKRQYIGFKLHLTTGQGD